MNAPVTSRCVIYARVSTKEQVSNLSLETQRERCEAHAHSNGWLVDRVFVEEGESAKTTDRTELQQLLEYCRASKGRVQFVLVYALNRLARNTHDHLALRGALAAMGIQLRSATERVEESSSGRFVETLLAAVAQFDNDARSERTVAGMRAAIARGRWPYSAPAGYLNARDAAGRPTLVFDPVRGPLVRKAFELAADGVTQRDILQRLRAEGLTTRTGRPFHSAALAAILRNPTYAGILRVEAWGTEAPAAFAPLVDETLFRTVQDALTTRRHPIDAASRQNPDFPLKGFVRCASCAKGLVGYWAQGRGRRYAYYECRVCRARVQRDALEDAFVDLLEELRPLPAIVKLFRLEVTDAWKDREAAASSEAQALHRQLDALRVRKERLVEGYLVERAMDRATYDGLMAKVEVQANELAAALSRATSTRLDAGGLLDYAVHVITHAGSLWRDAKPEQRLALQGFLFVGGLSWDKENGIHRTAVRGFDFNEIEAEPTPRTRFGGPQRDRTADLCVANAALSQLS
jgi:site-specific DNA recombinase